MDFNARSWGGLGRSWRSFCLVFSLLFFTSVFHRFFLDSMCCARTAALQCGNEKQKVNAIRDFAAILAQRPTKAVKMRTTGRQNLARASPEPPEIEAGSTHGSHDVATRPPRPSQISPKGVHECSRSGQRRPRTDQERAKRGSKPSNMEPDSAPNSILAPSLE